MSADIKTDAEEMGFDVVPVQSTDRADDFSEEKRIVATADKAALLYKGMEVYVQDLQLLSSGILSGQISDFSNICSTQYEGLSLGQKITFRYQHIQHTCG